MKGHCDVLWALLTQGLKATRAMEKSATQQLSAIFSGCAEHVEVSFPFTHDITFGAKSYLHVSCTDWLGSMCILNATDCHLYRCTYDIFGGLVAVC